MSFIGLAMSFVREVIVVAVHVYRFSARLILESEDSLGGIFYYWLLCSISSLLLIFLLSRHTFVARL